MSLQDGMMSAGEFFLRCAGWILIFLAPTQEAMTGVSFLVFANLLTGIWKSRKLHDQGLSGWGLWKSATKAVGYQMALVITYTAETVFMPGVPLTRAVAGFIAATELKSSLQNLSQITGIDLWQRVLDLLRRPGPPKN